MTKIKFTTFFVAIIAALMTFGCKTPSASTSISALKTPELYGTNTDSTNTSNVVWKEFFTDPYLINLLDEAVKNNQELAETLQEIEIAKNETRIKKGDVLPNLALKAGAGVEKVGRYTSQGAGDATTEIKPGMEMPEPLGDFGVSAVAKWEVDIWKKLRNSKKAAYLRYLSSQEGKNFVITNLISEVASSYYELLALDTQLAIIHQNIGLQQNGLEIVKVQKQAARTTELAVQKFVAEVRKSQSLEFEVRQQITETENRINFLVGRYPQPIQRATTDFLNQTLPKVNAGIPSQLLSNRPDIKQSELALQAAALDVKAARAEFYPSLEIGASIGTQAFKPSYLATLPESLLYSLIGELTAPLINRNRIKAEYNIANARQVQSVIQYNKTLLGAVNEISNQLSLVDNLQKNYGFKQQQVDALNTSIDASNELFKWARADYLEVLMTQRDALEAKLELVETRKNQWLAEIGLYRKIGGGWK